MRDVAHAKKTCKFKVSVLQSFIRKRCFNRKIKKACLTIKEENAGGIVGKGKSSAKDRIWRIFHVDFACLDVHYRGDLYPPPL